MPGDKPGHDNGVRALAFDIRYHGSAEQGVAFREIAEVIGKHLNLPVVSKSRDEAAGHFGWFAGFSAMDAPASSAWTQQQLGWQPTRPGLIADLDHVRYFRRLRPYAATMTRGHKPAQMAVGSSRYCNNLS